MKAVRSIVALLILALALLSAANRLWSVAFVAPGQHDLAVKYLSLVAPSNVASDKMYAAAQVKPIDGAKIRTAAANLSDTDIGLRYNLLAFEKTVPAKVRPHVEAARGALANETDYLQSIIVTTDDTGLIKAFNAFDRAYTINGAAFRLLRRDLGLSPGA